MAETPQAPGLPMFFVLLFVVGFTAWLSVNAFRHEDVVGGLLWSLAFGLSALSMGGLFTIIKVRDDLRSYDDDPGWFKPPPGTVALTASDADLTRDGIDVHASSTRSAPASETKRAGSGGLHVAPGSRTR